MVVVAALVGVVAALVGEVAALVGEVVALVGEVVALVVAADREAVAALLVLLLLPPPWSPFNVVLQLVRQPSPHPAATMPATMDATTTTTTVAGRISVRRRSDRYLMTRIRSWWSTSASCAAVGRSTLAVLTSR